MPKHRDEEIVTGYRAKMQVLARVLDGWFNDDKTGHNRETCFVLLVMPFGETEGRVNYISNGERSDIVTMMKETIARFEGQPEMKGSA